MDQAVAYWCQTDNKLKYTDLNRLKQTGNRLKQLITDIWDTWPYIHTLNYTSLQKSYTSASELLLVEDHYIIFYDIEDYH